MTATETKPDNTPVANMLSPWEETVEPVRTLPVVHEGGIEHSWTLGKFATARRRLRSATV